MKQKKQQEITNKRNSNIESARFSKKTKKTMQTPLAKTQNNNNDDNNNNNNMHTTKKNDLQNKMVPSKNILK